MVDINWKRFEAKFYGREREVFEELTYLLFCQEYNKPFGIFGYTNQTGFETNPIDTKKGLIGFQSKYFETKLDKSQIIDSIKKAKKKWPNAKGIYLYINTDIYEGKEEHSPKYKKEIEKCAADQGLVLTWKVKTQIEAQLSQPENHYLAEYFFTEGDNILNLIQNLNSHSENLLNSINTDIAFKRRLIKIDRSEELEKIEQKLKPSHPVIITGVGGSGKTALIKDFYLSKKHIPFYLFKATEFKLDNLGSLFKNYGQYQLKDFLCSHKEEKVKVVVIDSAEKLSDLENQDPFKEFLSALLKDSWSIIFTTRHNYVENLVIELSEVFRLTFSQINLSTILPEDLEDLSKKYDFLLPSDKRMKDILTIPFNLSLYLKENESFSTKKLVYSKFKSLIWRIKIQNHFFKKDNTHIRREKCFIELIKERVRTEQFYLTANEQDIEILALLRKDEIIEYDEETGKYFIAHDIYEEWGIDKFIERKYIERGNYYSFLQSLGTSLIVRRGFRNWLSDKLIDNIGDIKEFVETSFESNEIDDFWKSEILVSVLLSEYSLEFFNLFEQNILKNEGKLLKELIFLLRIGCKKPNNELINAMKLKSHSSFEYFFTTPTGKGWEALIGFINGHKDNMSDTLIPHIYGLLKDWSDNFNKGKTTREVGLIGLHYYDLQKQQHNWRRSDIINGWIKIILNSSLEISEELHSVFRMFLDLKEGEREKYLDLCEQVLVSGVSSRWVSKALPADVIDLMYYFWTDDRTKDRFGGGIGLDKEYGLNQYPPINYFPASAYQTPIFQLLKSHPYEALKFIVDFTNRSILKYVESTYDQTVNKVSLIIDNKEYLVYSSQGIWNTYRGNSSPTVPDLIQSIHMALERYLLEVLEGSIESQVIEKILVEFLLKRTKSVSIVAVVASIVLAFPNYFFKTAKILFSCEEFFRLDKQKATLEYTLKSLYSIGAGLNYRNKIYEDERLKTLEDNHRKRSLEDLILQYQFFHTSNLSKEQFRSRQEEIWKIIDAIYAKVPSESEQSEEDKIRRILLTRIDLRKMNPKTEVLDGGILVDFNPTIDADLEDHRKEALEDIHRNTHSQELFLWGISKFDGNTRGDYPQYENNPELALQETKNIIEELEKGDRSYEYRLFNHSIPGFTCAALIRDYSKNLTPEDKAFCERVIMDFATFPFNPEYIPQISDGVESSISVFPSLIKEFPQKKNDYLYLLFQYLFDERNLGNKRLCDYGIQVIQKNERIISEKETLAFLYAIIKYRPIFRDKLESLKRKKGSSTRRSLGVFIKEFLGENEKEIKSFFNDPLHNMRFNLDEMKISDLDLVFQLIPNTTKSVHLLDIAKRITTKLAEELFIKRDYKEEHKENIYELRLRFFRKFSYFILQVEREKIKSFIGPFTKNFRSNENGVSFLGEIINANCFLSKYNNFWEVWNNFYSKINKLVQVNNHHTSQIIHYYLLAWPYWKDSANNWHSLKEREKQFYKKAAKDFGDHTATLDSICQILNSIGERFLNEGIFWISDLVSAHDYNKLENNTQYYLEALSRKYIYNNRGEIKKDSNVKKKVLVILEFLIERGSVDGYLLRDDIL